MLIEGEVDDFTVTEGKVDGFMLIEGEESDGFAVAWWWFQV